MKLSDLHGSVLTAENGDGEREDMAGFTCDDWPECETCGHIDESLVDWDHLSAENQNDGWFNITDSN